MIKQCKVCECSTSEYFSKKILQKYSIRYYQCNSCKFIQTEEPFWLIEAYSNAITKQDIGLINRNIMFAPLTSLLIKIYFNKYNKFLDYGGGYGMFVRLMRDIGFNFKRYDTYCENLFAKGFDEENLDSYELITAFEVFEHLPDPMSEIDLMLKRSKNIFFSTELQPINLKPTDDWWYIMPETGQHVSLFTIKSLQFIAKKYHLNLYSNEKNFHLITEKKLNPTCFKFVTNYYVMKILNKLYKNPTSLLQTDYKNKLSEPFS